MLPTLRQRAAEHLEETRRHAEIVHTCLQSLGADVSTLKTGMATMLELGKGMGTMFASDERVKDLLAAYGSEHFEIACYKALRAGAEVINEPQIVAACDRIIPDEEKMALWLSENLPAVVREYLATTASA
jgi:ferritin-like metal-binding protein YciE